MTSIAGNTDEPDLFSELVDRTKNFIRRELGAGDGISVVSFIGHTGAPRGQGKWIALRVTGFQRNKTSLQHHTGVYKESVNTTPPSTVLVDGKPLRVFFPVNERSFGMFGYWPDGMDAIAMFPWETEESAAQQNEETKSVLRKGIDALVMMKMAGHPAAVQAQKALESGGATEMTSALATIKCLMEKLYRELPSDDDE